jgi:Cu/Ag efflux protein CusF
MRDNVKRQIYEQTRDKPGVVKTDNTHAIRYKKEPVNPSPSYNPNIEFNSKQYSQNRGAYYPLDPLKFSYHSGQGQILGIPSNAGAFSIQLPNPYTNIVVGCTLVTTRARRVTIRPRIANGSVVVYLDNFEVYSSGDLPYIESDIVFTVDGEQTLRIFVYKESGNSSFSLLTEMGNEVDGWSGLDVSAPPIPTWYGNPSSGFNVSTQSPYIRLQWDDPGTIFYASGINNIEGGAINPDIEGFTIYRSIFTSVLPVNGVDTISGNFFIINGDYESQFVSGTEMNLNSGAGGTYPIQYARYKGDEQKTLILVSGTITGSEGQSIYSQTLEPITSVQYTPQPNGIFTYDDYTITYDTTYKYALDSYDGFYNRSAKSVVKAVTAVNALPDQAHSQFANLVGYNTIKINWQHDYPSKVGKFNVWDIMDGENTSISAYSGSTVTVSDSSIFTIGNPCIVYTGGNYYSEVVVDVDGSDVIVGNAFSTSPSPSDVIYAPAVVATPAPSTISGQFNRGLDGVPATSQWYYRHYRNADINSTHRFWISAHNHGGLANYRDFPYTNAITVSGLSAPTYNNSDHLYSSLTDFGALPNAEEVSYNINAYSDSILSPIVAVGVETTSPYTNHLLIQCATNTSYDPPIGLVEKIGHMTVSGTSRILNATVFNHTLKNATYYFRMAQVDGLGNTGAWGSWVSETAGDSTGPDNFGSFTLESTGLTITGFDDSYTPPADIDRYEWWASAVNSDPTSNDPDVITSTPKVYFNLNSGTWFLFGRIVDKSGNYNSTYDETLGSAALEGISQSLVSGLVSDLTDKFSKSTDDLDDITTGSTNVHFTATDETKLDGIEESADVNPTDAEIVTAVDNEGGIGALSGDLDDITDGTLYKKTYGISNLINNFSKTSSEAGWAQQAFPENIEISETDLDGRTVVTLMMSGTDNAYAMSSFVDIDPNNVYKFSVAIKGSPTGETSGGRYFGLTVNDKDDVQETLRRFNVAGHQWSATYGTNSYFWTGDLGANEWRFMTAYLLPSGIPLSKIPNGENVTYLWGMPASSQKARMRLLSYISGASEPCVDHFYSPSIKPVDSSSVQFKDQIGDLDDIDTGSTNVHFTTTDETKLDGVEDNATADQSEAEIVDLVNNTADNVNWATVNKTGSDIADLASRSLDDITQGSTNYYVNANELAGAGRAYNAINSSNHIVAPLYDVDGGQLLFDNTYKQLNYDLVISGTLSIGDPSGQHIYLDGPNAVMKFVTSTTSRGTPVITIDDNIYSSLPGIKLKDGIVHITDDSNLNTRIEPGDIDIYANSSSIPATLDINQYYTGAAANYGAYIDATGTGANHTYGVWSKAEATTATGYAGWFQSTDIPLVIAYDSDTYMSFDISALGDVTANATSASYITFNNDTDYYLVAGRAYIGYNEANSDYASFGHIDRRSSGNYGVMQDTNGNLFLNASTSRSGYLRINDATIASWDASQFDLPTPKYVDVDDVVMPTISEEGGTKTARTIETVVTRLGGALSAAGKRRNLVHWWFSTTSYGAPAVLPGSQTVSLNNGTLIDGTLSNTAARRECLTDSTAELEILISNSHTGADPDNLYFMIEVQGIVYSLLFTLQTNDDA